MCIRDRRIENHEQKEYPDMWLKLGNVWEVKKPKHAIEVKFGGHIEMYMDEHGKTKVNHIADQAVSYTHLDVYKRQFEYYSDIKTRIERKKLGEMCWKICSVVKRKFRMSRKDH